MAESEAAVVPMAKWDVNSGRSIVWCNSAWRECLNLKPEVHPRDWINAVKKEDVVHVLKAYGKLIESERSGAFAFRCHNSDWVVCDRASVRDAGGTLTHYLGTLTRPSVAEISQLDQALDATFLASKAQFKHHSMETNFSELSVEDMTTTTALAQLEQRTTELAVLAEMSQVGLVRAGKDGAIHWVNDAWRSIMRLRPDQAPEEWTQAIHPDYKEVMIEAWTDAIVQNINLSITIRLVHGLYIHVQSRLNTTDRDAATWCMAAITDVTASWEAEEKLLRMSQQREVEAIALRDEAVKLRQQQELLMDTTSHELRNPVSAVLQLSSLCRANMQLLYDELQKAVVSETPFSPTESLLNLLAEDIDGMQSIMKSSAAQGRICEDVLSLAKIHLGSLEVHPTTCSLHSEVSQILSMFDPELRTTGVQKRVIFGPVYRRFREKNSLHVTVDIVRLGQIITNLFQNSLQFTNNAISIHLEVSLRPPDEQGSALVPSDAGGTPAIDAPMYFYCAIADNGPGMPASDVAMLFQKFTQAKSNVRGSGGAGLGLYISRLLCNLLGGEIEAVSEEGKGSIFRFFIKTIQAKPPDDASSPTSPVSPSTTEGRPMHILVTEDNLINSKVLIRQLTKAKFTTEAAENGIEALAAIDASLAKARPFDCILMDLEMPGMGGLEAIKHIRSRESAGLYRRRTRVVCLTGNARKEQIQEAMDAGMDDVITKPYVIDVLLKAVRAL
ncbi:hypothetical protein HKX48_006256 [Thoreauomyces humboldtii]|nr:hypothetical protein HKX48_006256 [Thoreauomyces humboldtii]